MTNKQQSRGRFEAFNQLVDDVLPSCSNAESVLLVYYFRHGRLRGQGEFSRNVFAQSDGQAAKSLGKSRQTIRKTRLDLIRRKVISKLRTKEGRIIYMIGTPPSLPPELGGKSDSATMSGGEAPRN